MKWFKFFAQSTFFERKLGYKFKNRELFLQALTHKSYVKNSENNERLEYLGDAVLNLVLGDILMKKYPSAQEGMLSKMRSSLVSTHGLYKQAQALNIKKELELNFGRKTINFRSNARLLAGFFEALIGAVYLDGGYSKAQKVISSIFQKKLNQDWVDQDYKTILQGKSQKLFQQIPEYKVVSEQGPSHKKNFVVQVYVQSEILGVGKGFTKKSAEQSAAESALRKFDHVFKQEEKS